MVFDTISKIEKTLSRIRTHPEYSAHVRKEATRSLEEEAYRHSVAIEGEESRAELKQSLSRAWTHLGEYGITLSSLSTLGKIVEPKNQYALRTGEVLFGPNGGAPVNALHQELDNLVYFLNETQANPIVRASEAHIELIRIHPYQDGNGRSARILQNFCLEQKDYPPAVIKEDERELYINLLNLIQKERGPRQLALFDHDVHAKSGAEKAFHGLLASKVLESTQRLEDELKKRRMYEVNVNSGDKALLISLARHIGGIARATPEKPVTTSVNKRERKICVTGNVSAEELNQLLHTRVGKLSQPCTYEVVPITN